MIRLRRYKSLLAAQQAAAYLRSSGITATVVGDHVNAVMGPGLARYFGVDLVILMKEHQDEAVRLLDEFDALPASLDEDWEAESVPDLSLLDDSEISISCPHCQGVLPLDAMVETCPTCDGAVNPVQRVLEQHGPDVLADCYDYEEERMPGIDEIPIGCSACGYDLRLLPIRGRCPECGTLYDKDDFIRRLRR